MAALGLFDVQGLTNENPTLQFGSPIFEKVTIQLDPNYYQGKELVIEAKNNSKQNVYIQSGQWNTEKLANCWIDFKKLTQGGKLVFEMGSQPNTAWGTSTPPPSMSSKKK
jgi:putative alpha-1,2-mannosidase